MQDTIIPATACSVTLHAPDDFRLPDLDDVGLAVAPLGERTITTVVWDTPDLRLARWGASLTHRAGEGWAVELPTADERSHTVHRIAGEEDSVPTGVLDLVAAFARTAEVRPMVRLTTLRRAIGLIDEAGRTVVEVDDHAPVPAVAGHPDGGRELEVAALAGAPGSLLRQVVRHLEAAGASVDGAAAALRHTAGDAVPPEVEPGGLGRRATAGDVVRRAIAGGTVRLIRHDAAVRLGGDPEAVHQARVAARRLRSDLRTFAPLLAEEWSRPLREELRWLGALLGRVRDGEVLLEELQAAVHRLPVEDAGAAAELLAGLRSEIADDRERLLEAMRSPRYRELLDRLVEASHNPALLAEAEGRATTVLPRLVRRPWRRLRRDARGLDAGSTDAELHAVRIRAKRARYAAEAAAPVLGGRAKRFAGAVADLQSVLGAHQDAVVAVEWLRRGRAGSSAPAFAAGQLAGLERQTAAVARVRWPRAWRAARRRKLRSWM